MNKEMKYFFNKQYRIYSWGIWCLAAGLLSCNKLLDIPSHPDDKLSADRVYSDSVNVMGALVGLYANFKVGGSGGAIFGSDLTFYAGMSADEVFYPSSTQLNDFTTNELQVDNGEVNTLWSSCYTGIYQANAFLEGVTDNKNISLALQQQVRGEALVTRALYYFQLVNLYGAVPYVTTTDFKVNAALPRSSTDSIYNLIQSDLTTAMTLLTTKYPSAGRARPNIQVARALLAKVYLYRRQWQQASDQANQLITDGSYQLTDLDKIFYDGSTEAIWQVPSVATYGQVAETGYFIPYSPGYLPSFVLADPLVNAFEAGDNRKATWIRTTVVNNVTYYYPVKYRNKDLTATPKESLMFFRLGEQYLIRAEASAQLDLLDSARADINRIRHRAGLGNTPAVSKDDVLLAIEHERQTELFCELGQRWYDLKRTGRATAVLGALRPATWQATDALYPVPLAQRQSNPFLTQNLGYH